VTGADTVFLQFGSMDRTLEDTAFTLNSRRHVSGVLRSDLYGWGLVVFMGERSNAEAWKKSIPDRRTAVESIIRRRKQDARAASYTGSVLSPQRAEADPALFERAAATLLELVLRNPEARASKGVYRIFVTDLDTVERMLEADLQRVFVHTASGGLTVADVLDGLRSRDMSVVSLDPERFRNRLNAYIRDVVAGELIAREGYRQGLERSENVRRDVAVWERTWAATALVRNLTETMEVTDAEVMDYCVRNGAVLGRPYEVNIREVLSDSLAGSMRVLERMSNGEDLADLARDVSTRNGWRITGGESGYFNVGARPALGFAALWTDSGSIGGPVKLPEGYSLFRVLGKRVAVRDSVPSPDSLNVLARRAVRAERQRRVVEEYVSRLAKENGVNIHYDRLRGLRVNAANMVTRRFIGFGGVITAVPSITPIWKWEGEQPNVVP
jgi:parvulin-like peptidyl-prolyl isomerase